MTLSAVSSRAKLSASSFCSAVLPLPLMFLLLLLLQLLLLKLLKLVTLLSLLKPL